MKQLFEPRSVQHIHSVDYSRGTERHRVVTRVHETGVSVTVFWLGGLDGKHQKLWHADNLGDAALPATDFSAVR